MSVLEFIAQVKGGQIEIPQEYRETLKSVDAVRVMVTSKSPTAAIGIIAQLMEHPIELKNFVPLTRDEIHERG